MSPETPLPVSFLKPGASFLLFLAALVAFGLILHAWALHRLGGERLDRYTRRTEGTLFCLLLAVMLCFSGLQVVLRNFFHGGVIWIDPLVRTCVLWMAFFGALTATSHARHLHIDALRRNFPVHLQLLLTRVLSALAAGVCAFLANGAYIYVLEESQQSSSPFLGIPSWASQSILLWGFALLSYRFGVQAIWPAPPEGHP